MTPEADRDTKQGLSASDGLKDRSTEPSEEKKMAYKHAGYRINVACGADLEDDISLRRILNKTSKDPVSVKFRETLDGLPDNRGGVCRSFVTACRHSRIPLIRTIGDIRGLSEDELYRVTNVGPLGCIFLRTAFARPRPQA